MFNELGNGFSMVIGIFFVYDDSSNCATSQYHFCLLFIPSQGDFCQLFELQNIHVLKLRHCSWKTRHIPDIKGLCYRLCKFTKLFYGKLLYYEQEANLIT